MKDEHTQASIAAERGCAEHKVKAAIDKFRLIPVRWVGRSRIFDDAQRAQIVAELDRIIDRKKEKEND